MEEIEPEAVVTETFDKSFYEAAPIIEDDDAFTPKDLSEDYIDPAAGLLPLTITPIQVGGKVLWKVGREGEENLLFKSKSDAVRFVEKNG